MDIKAKMQELIDVLNRASDAYYNDKDEIMSNYEWDSLYDELVNLEKESGIVLEDSPTNKTGADENISNGQREAHEFPALSLAKSKDVEVIKKWAGDRKIWLSWKLDGLTLVLTYDDGILTKIMTRGNGTTGTNITFMAPYINGVPEKIKDKGHFVVRGEAVISYTDFANINSLIENADEQYSNPRNLVSGSLGLDISRAREVKERGVSFNAFTLVYCETDILSWGDRMDYLKKLGFTVVDSEATDANGLAEVIDKWTVKVQSGKMDLPVDGLVITFDDTEYAATGSVTGHHATNAGMAFKWQDTVAETVLDHIEWSCAAFAISPVAVFDPVVLEQTTVSRASLCNISEMYRLGIGADRKTKLSVIKSNMIIPKCIAADANGTKFEIPSVCPVCKAPTEIVTSEKTGTQTLHCTNPDCSAKHIQKITRFVSKSGMDIDGLSIKTLMRFINDNIISDCADLYEIEAHREKIIGMEGFGQKSYDNLIASIEKSEHVHPVNFIYALCIPLIGLDAAKRIIKEYGTEGFLNKLKDGSSFAEIDGIGPERSNSIIAWYNEQKNKELLDKLLAKIELEKLEPVSSDEGALNGVTFVITGDVHSFKNRDEFKAFVEKNGGHVAGSVSKKTNFLVNNDINSTSSKNKKARELNIPIITEDEFIERFGEE